jgi:hypothetical protein
MTRYLLSVHTGNGSAPEKMTEEEMRRGYEQIATLEAEMNAARALVFSGRLDGPDRARVVRPSKGRPYAETKEHLGGFYIIDAPDIDAATDWATKVSLAINTPIEVRPFFDTR